MIQQIEWNIVNHEDGSLLEHITPSALRTENLDDKLKGDINYFQKLAFI